MIIRGGLFIVSSPLQICFPSIRLPSPPCPLTSPFVISPASSSDPRLEPLRFVTLPCTTPVFSFLFCLPLPSVYACLFSPASFVGLLPCPPPLWPFLHRYSDPRHEEEKDHVFVMTMPVDYSFFSFVSSYGGAGLAEL